MRLAEFILANVEPILAEWVKFAGTLAPGATMTKLALRDDAEAILRAAALGMLDDQSHVEQASKSKGHGGSDTAESARLDNASTRHGGERAGSGFDIEEVVSEYRALRASVLRLWRKTLPQPDFNDIDDITRFSESIDQSLAAAIGSYTERVGRSSQMFLAILGHDLRNPLYCIRVGAQLLSAENRDPKSAETLVLIGKELDVMEKLISDLIDFASTWLGGAMPLNREWVDLQKLCPEVVDGYRALYPRRALHFHPHGDLTGNWDAARLRQVVSNLLGNAFQHGSPEGPVELSAASEGSDVVLSVHNDGEPIPPEALPTLFNPLVRLATEKSTLPGDSGNIGLGLYIVSEIVNATGGTIDVASTAQQGTTFTVTIPRQPAVEEINEKPESSRPEPRR